LAYECYVALQRTRRQSYPQSERTASDWKCASVATFVDPRSVGGGVQVPSHRVWRLFDGHAFGQISRFVDVAAACHGDVVGDQLQGDAGDDRLEKLLDVRDFDNVVGK